MYTFIASSSEKFDQYLLEAVSECNSILNMYDLNKLIQESDTDSKSSSRIKNILDSIVKFLRKIIISINKFSVKITEKFKEVRKSDSMSLKMKFNKIKKDLQKIKKNGVTSYEFYDMKAFDKAISSFDKDVTKMIYSWESKIKKGTATPNSAENFIKNSDNLIKKYNDKITAIRSKKKPTDIDIIIKWIDGELDGKSAAKYAVSSFNDNIKKLITVTTDVKNQLNEYSEETGYVIMAKSIKDIAHNTVLFLKKNYDWCAAYAASSILILYSVLTTLDSSSKSHERISNGKNSNDYTLKKTIHSAVGNVGRMEQNEIARADTTISNHPDAVKARINTTTSASAAAITAAAGTTMLNNAIKSGRNSIYSTKK